MTTTVTIDMKKEKSRDQWLKIIEESGLDCWCGNVLRLEDVLFFEAKPGPTCDVKAFCPKCSRTQNFIVL